MRLSWARSGLPPAVPAIPHMRPRIAATTLNHREVAAHRRQSRRTRRPRPVKGSGRIPERMTDRRALITGITGQDGSYLAEFLLGKGYDVYGMTRRASTENVERIGHLIDRLTLLQGDLLDQPSLDAALRGSQPHEVYNLAAQSFVPTSWNQPVLTAEFTAVGVTRDARGDPLRRPRDPLLPGVVVGDVRQGARDPADRDDAVPPPLALRGGQGLRAPHHGQLPRVVRPVRRLGDPVQPRVATARARVRHAQDHATASRASSTV